MTEKTDLDYAHEAIDDFGGSRDQRRYTAQTYALLSIAGSLARLVELIEADTKRSNEWQERVNEAESTREASLRAREAEGHWPWGKRQSAGQPKDDRFDFNPAKPPGEQYTYKSQSAGQSLPPEIWPESAVTEPKTDDDR